jgi:hypothetical protein
MKNIIILFSLLLITSISFAQTKDRDLLVKYSKEELNTLKKDNPKEYEFAKYCVRNAFYIAEMPEEKIKANPSKFGEITIKNISKINFYQLNIELKEDDYQSFVIKGTKKILVVKSKSHILRELNKKQP